MGQNYGVVLVLLFPALGGFIGFYLGKENKKIRNTWLDIVVTVELAMLLYMGYFIIGKKTEFSLAFSNYVINFSLTLDSVRLVFCVITAVLFGIAVQFMKESMKREPDGNNFYRFYMCIYSMILGAYMTSNLYRFSLFVVLALVCAHRIYLQRLTVQTIKNTQIFMATVFVCIAIFLIGFSGVYLISESVNYTEPYYAFLSDEVKIVFIICSFIVFIGFAIFAGIFPVQFQVTRGCSYCLIELSAVLACLASRLGLFGMMIFTSWLTPFLTFCGKILLVLGPLTTIWGLLITLTSTDIRKILTGLNIAANGFNTLSIAFMILNSKSNGYAIQSSVLAMLVFSLSLFIMYMIILEQVYKIHNYEINGLIASGKGNKLLAVVCFIACANLIGVPGTAGFLAHSMIFNTIIMNNGWKWLTVVYILLWAFFMTAVVRIFMKLFVSRKEKTLHILTAKEEMKSEAEGKRTENKKKRRKSGNPYLLGEIMLLGIGFIQVAVGIIPDLTFGKLGNDIVTFFHGENTADIIPYFTRDTFMGFGIALLLCIVLYVNLVHGILLRAIRNKKNKKLKENL